MRQGNASNKYIGNYLKNSFIKPKNNLKNSDHISIVSSVLLILAWFILIIFLGFFVNMFIMTNMADPYAGMGISVYMTLIYQMFGGLFLIILNTAVIYNLNLRYLNEPLPYSKVLSDNLSILYLLFLLYILGASIASYITVSSNAANQLLQLLPSLGLLISYSSFFIYGWWSIRSLRYYLKQSNMDKSRVEYSTLKYSLPLTILTLLYTFIYPIVSFIIDFINAI